jgi:hypothetical protein
MSKEYKGEEQDKKSEVEQFLNDNENMTVEVSEGVTYNLRDVINDNYRLYNAKFEDGAVEENGFVRVFMRKLWVVYRTLIQGSDVDMKDLNVRSLNGVKIRMASILKMLTVSHLDRTGFGEYLDETLEFMCWHGSAITKRCDGSLENVDLRNYTTESNVQDPQQRRHAEYVYYDYDKMMSYKDEMSEEALEAVEANWEEMNKNGISQFKVVEFWTWGTIGDDEEEHKICVKYLDNQLNENHEALEPNEWQPFIELFRFKTPYKKRRDSKRMREKLGEYEEMFPYNQYDLFKVPGRALAFGCAELLIGCQELYNELYSNKRKIDLRAVQGITVHNAIQGVDGLSELTQDFISNLSTGAVVSLAPGESLDQLRVDTSNTEFNLMDEKIYELMRQIIGVTATGTGEEVPASTSATQAAINEKTAQTVYDYVRERMQHGIKRLFNDGYSKDVIEEIEEEDVATIIGDPTELREMDKYLIDEAVAKWVLKVKEATGVYPSPEEVAMETERITNELKEQGDMRFPEFKKALLKEMELNYDFSVTQEGFDSKLRSEALIAMKNDPQSSKSKEKVEDELLSLQGLNPRDYDKSPEELEKEQMLQQMAQQSVNPPTPAL